MAQVWLCDQSRGEAHPDLRLFERRFISDAASNNIPLYSRQVAWASVEVVHAQWEDKLDPRDWWIIGNIGMETSRAVGLHVDWGGRPDGVQLIGGHPSIWEVDCQDGCSD